MELEKILRSGLDSMKVPYSEETINGLKIYFEYLEEKNKVMDLTAISGEKDVAQLHFLDCASILANYDLKNKKVIDVGCGAGFPGMVLKIIEPSIKLTLLDSLDKRLNFLREVCEKLNLENVECIHARAEEVDKSLREKYDYATSRAVARMNKLTEICMPYVKLGGSFIAMKGPECEEELNEAKKAVNELGGACKETVIYTIPETDINHSLVRVEKIKQTPAKYPRKWAQIKTKPII